MIDLIDISIQFAGTYLFENVNLRINNSDKIETFINRSASSNSSNPKAQLRCLTQLSNINPAYSLFRKERKVIGNSNKINQII